MSIKLINNFIKKGINMNSKEIVIRTLNFENPERVAHSFDTSDFCGAGPTVETHATEWEKIDKERWESTDEWGNQWVRIEDTSKGEVEKGVLGDISEIEDYEFPDYSKIEDYESVKEIVKGKSDFFVLGWMPGFTFNIARKLLRLDQYMIDLLLEPEFIKIMHDKIDVMLMDMIRNYAASGVNGIMFPEDWGTQNQTLISPKLWHEEFAPRTKQLCSLAHDLGLKVLMHSCGKIEKIIPGLIDAGIDCLQFDQPTLHGIDTLASYQENAKITFWCPVDIQKTLQTHDESLIRKEAREMIDKLWKGKGGFIAGYYNDNASIGLDPKWQNIACDEFLK